jgi:hypothetical protein
MIFHGDNNDCFGFAWDHSNSGWLHAAYHQNSSGGYHVAQTTTSLVGGTWYLIHGQWDGSNLKAYVNGALETTTTSVTSMQTFNNPSQGITFSFFASGAIEEMRFTKNATRSDSWITADYNNQNDPATFVTFGTETAL